MGRLVYLLRRALRIQCPYAEIICFVTSPAVFMEVNTKDAQNKYSSVVLKDRFYYFKY